MTCIIGFVHDGKVYMGSDSFAVDGYVQQPIINRKVFRKNELLIGVTGGARVMQIMRYQLERPKVATGPDYNRHLILSFVEPTRKLMKEAGFSVNSDQAETIDAQMLIGYQGRLLHMDAHFSLTEPVCGFTSIGNGSEFATGAFYAMPELPPRERILKSLEIAGDWCWGVGAPYYVEEL